jgi:hypothetical protein
MLHRFADSLAMSESYVDAPWWLEVYRQAFPRLVAAVPIREDGWAQRAGIDRRLTLSCGQTLTIDEKVRAKDWPDFLLERWADAARKKPGWIQKPLVCDFIAYAYVPSRTCYLLPTPTLQRAWKLHGREWAKRYGEIRAQNPGYVTTSVPVPRDVLLRALQDAMTVRWAA